MAQNPQRIPATLAVLLNHHIKTCPNPSAISAMIFYYKPQGFVGMESEMN
jgi:hypothetical protein